MKKQELEITERSVIVRDLWEQEMQFRKDTKNSHTVQVEQKLFKELNELGYDFYWSWQFQPGIFTEKDKAVIPIIIKYLDELQNQELKNTYLFCLGVKGFYDATEYLIDQYEKLLPPNYSSWDINFVSQAISNIQDPRYIDTYLRFLEEDEVVCEAWHIVRMLGNMKIEAAIPYLIKLLDGGRKINQKSYGTVLEVDKYYLSQCAIDALSRYKNPEHIKYIVKFLEPEKLTWIDFTDSKVKQDNLKETYLRYKKNANKAIKRMSK